MRRQQATQSIADRSMYGLGPPFGQMIGESFMSANCQERFRRYRSGEQRHRCYQVSIRLTEPRRVEPQDAIYPRAGTRGCRELDLQGGEVTTRWPACERGGHYSDG